jgi:hypothetical protein
MIVTIHQPNYLPYLGYFDKMAKADVFVLYDTAEFVKEMFYNRNKIKTKQGELWLTVPVRYEHSNRSSIKEIKLDNTRRWYKKHWQSIVQSYAKAPFCKEISEFIAPIYEKEWYTLSEPCNELIIAIVKYLEIETKIVLASELEIEEGLNRSEKLIAICKAADGTSYLSGNTGLNYLDPADFERANLGLEFQKYTHPEYTQLHGDFIKNLCILDLLFNHGKAAKSILIN